MAYPVDANRFASGSTVAETAHTVQFSTAPVVGELLIVFYRFAGAPGSLTYTGFTSLANDTSDASDDSTTLWWKWADGTETATTTLTSGNAIKGAAITWQVTGAKNIAPTLNGPAVGTAANQDAQDSAPGNGDWLIITVIGLDGETQSPTGVPTNYGNRVDSNSGTAGAVATNTIICGVSRQVTITSGGVEVIGAWTHPAPNSGVTSYTLAIPPAPSAPMPRQPLLMTLSRR